MPVQLVNGYVLLSQLPDWTDGVAMVLQWLTEIALARRGYEDRASMRPSPQAQMAWQVITTSVQQGAALEDSVRAALRSGQACAPCFPRPSYVAAVNNTGLQVTLEPTQWAWAANDYLYAVGMDGTSHVCQVQAVNGLQLTLTTALPVLDTVWPLIFGRLETEDVEQEGPDTLAVNCRLHLPTWRQPHASVAPLVFNGAPVAPAVVAANWDDTVNRSFAYDQAVEQIGFGVETLEPEQSYVQHGIELSARLASEGDISDLEAFLGSLGGRRGNFWLPGTERAMLISDQAVPSPYACDFVVIRYQWVQSDGDDLDTQTALIAPTLESDVGWDRQNQVPAAALQPFLRWGGDSDGPPLESVLVNFAAIAAAYPSLSTVKVRLRAIWSFRRGDGNINVQIACYSGGTMQGPTTYDFTNSGGAQVQTMNTTVQVPLSGSNLVAGTECGTLVYDTTTKVTQLLPPGA